MAVFLLKAKHGLCYTPPPCTVQVFTDVPCSSGFAPWINELVAEGITGGCGDGTTYCPDEPRPAPADGRAPAASAFEGSALHAAGLHTATFADVPCSSRFAPLDIYELAAEQHHGRLRPPPMLLSRRHQHPRPDGGRSSSRRSDSSNDVVDSRHP